MDRRRFLRDAGLTLGAGLVGCGRGSPPAAPAAPTGLVGAATVSAGVLDVASWESIRQQFALKRGVIHLAGFFLASHPTPVRGGLRGDVRDYAKAAKRHLEEGGMFVYCFLFQQRQRAVDAAHAEGFSIVHARDVVPREGLEPLFSLFACKLGAHPEAVEPPFVVRHAKGAHAQDLVAVRRRFGWL